MTDTKHTFEPWYPSLESDGWRVMASDENGGYTLADMCCDDQEANARRIVACVNACAGIPTEWLSSGLTGCLQNVRAERDEYKKQRDELLAALENCRLLAARHRKEEWAGHVLRFCGESGVAGEVMR